HQFGVIDGLQRQATHVGALVTFSEALRDQAETLWVVAHEICVHAQHLAGYAQPLMDRNETILMNWQFETTRGQLSQDGQHWRCIEGNVLYLQAREVLVAFVRTRSADLARRVDECFANELE